MAKKYYWLKLKKTFFNQKEIKRLRRLAGGDTFTIIYLKLLLLSLENEGKIYFEDIGDDFVDELALEIDEDDDNIKMTLSYLFSKGLIETVDDKEYFLNDIPEMIGSESESARRVRKHRQRKKQQTLQCNSQVTKRNTEIETEEDKDLDKEKEPDKETAEIIQFWDENGFGVNNIHAKKQLLLWLNDSSFKEPRKVILKALNIACGNGARRLKYTEGILKNWENESLLTVEEINNSQNKRQKQVESISNIIDYDPERDRF
ncbi:hypothetical protein CIL03_10310 [Virgibacillus indicus]|uniref:DnaD domain protein n=1 Tax=Virgibacillus indicus TaxID=2024554 RepID=A0A265N9K0_9BACI|nr:phage replisome organizer N-terminal domain-containing protein [Virgibacillus indicus]OZU88673.1 hypothetical protein CIL03_10310 [Virgibacillus indicus]